MSSKNAMYESSTLAGFAADEDGGFTVGCFKTVGVSAGWEATDADETDGFGFVFGAADSLLTRTDAGTMAVNCGVC